MRRARPDQTARLALGRARAQALRAEHSAARAGIRGRREAARARKKKPQKRGRWLLLLLLLLLLVLCCGRDCSCAQPVAVAESGPELGPVEPVPAEAPIEVPTGRVERMDRPEYTTDSLEPPAWIAAFRMQVAARGPRLAECFVGSQRPGRLKWTTSVEPGSGKVSEHLLEPVLMSDELTRKESTCVLEVLSDPAFKLELGEERSTPARVGMVIEF